MAATMRVRLLTSAAISVAAFLVIPITTCAQEASLPHLEKRGVTTQLVVDGKPFLYVTDNTYFEPGLAAKFSGRKLSSVICSIY